jgi:hypothetical protein
MVARVAVFEEMDMEAAQASMDEAEAVIRPLVQGLSGYAGRFDLASPDGGFIAITLFDTMENAEAAEPTFDEEMPRRLGNLFQSWGGRRVSVGRYQVVTDERA